MSVAAAVRGEASRSLSLPENRLTSNSPQQQQQQQPVLASPSSSSSVIESVEEKCPRTSLDSVTAAAPQCPADRTPAPADAKPAPAPVCCDVIVTSHDVIQSPARSVRPTRLDLAAVQASASKAELSPDDRKHLVGILHIRSPRRTSNLLASLGFVVVLNLLVTADSDFLPMMR